MKKTLIIPALIFALSLISCNKESVNSNESDQVNKELAAAASKAFSTCGVWHIEIYTPNGVDATTTYQGYHFSFCPDNNLAAYNDILSIPGFWYLLLGKGGNTSYFQIDFKSNDQTGRIEELDGMWVIKGLTEDKITLENQAETTRLVFVLDSK